ncbi:MAG TPA: hypothetical protein VFS46_03160 [Nitrososphaera sp.]|nr:hypothetical protein [Nitrososphaera sp.]
MPRQRIVEEIKENTIKDRQDSPTSGKPVETEESASSRKLRAKNANIAKVMHAVVASKPFDMAITAVILLQAVALAIEAMPTILPAGTCFGIVFNGL